MYFDFNQKSSLLLFFIIHGVVMCILLFIKYFTKKDPHSFWLGLFTVLSVLYVFPFAMGYAGWYAVEKYRTFLFYFPCQQLYLMPPILYFFIRSLLDAGFEFKRIHWLHFIPSIVYGLYILWMYIADNYWWKTRVFYADGKDKDFDSWYQISGFLVLIFYTVAAIKLYLQYKKISFNALSFAESVLFKWAKYFLYFLLALLMLRLLFFILNPEWASFGKKFWYYLSFSIICYFATLFGYSNVTQSSIGFNLFATNAQQFGNAINDAHANEEQEFSHPAVQRYIKVEVSDQKNSNLPDSELNKWKLQLESFVQTNLSYENHTLSILDISTALNTHPKKISQVINQGYGLNFNDYINELRVEAVIRKLKEGELEKQNLLGIAIDAGFNSKSTFNRAFKKRVGMTPKEFIEQNGIK